MLDTEDKPSVNDMELLDASIADAVPARLVNSKFFTVDVDGLVKISYLNDAGLTITETMQVYAGERNYIKNVSRLWNNCIATEARSYDANGNLILNAIKIRR